MNALFGRHCAIVGTTGGGKSWTVAKLIEEVKEKTDTKIILIDATGEYEGIEDDGCVVGDNAYFSFKSLNNSEFCFLFREHSPNTSNALCEAINTLKLVRLGKLQDGVKIGKKINDLNQIVADNIKDFAGCDFDISQLPIQIKNECVKQSRTNTYEADDFKLGYCSHLISRINMFLQNETIKGALGIENRDGKSEIISLVDAFLQDNSKNILRIGFERLSYDFAIREIIVDFIAAHLLRKSRKFEFKENPIILWCLLINSPLITDSYKRNPHQNCS